LTVGRPEYSPSPIGILDLIFPPEESGGDDDDDDDYDWVNDPEGRKGLPDPGYDNDPNRPDQSGDDDMSVDTGYGSSWP
jgi:hypothetical protein